jgi:DNA-binding FrmR family transcriptional regulator
MIEIEVPATEKSCCKESQVIVSSHPSHRSLLNRFKRTEGQFRGILTMIATERYCVDILVQTRALIAALKAAEREILDRHIQHCVSNAIDSPNSDEAKIKLQELATLVQRMAQ